jgi:hypothetical protein
VVEMVSSRSSSSIKRRDSLSSANGDLAVTAPTLTRAVSSAAQIEDADADAADGTQSPASVIELALWNCREYRPSDEAEQAAEKGRTPLTLGPAPHRRSSDRDAFELLVQRRLGRVGRDDALRL